MVAAPFHQDHHDDISARRDERKLVAYIRAGDVAAFEHLVKTHSEEMVRFAATHTGSWDSAQDIVQNIFVSIWARHASWEVNTSLAAYLYRSVTHGIAKYNRGQQRAVPIDSTLLPSGTESDDQVNSLDINTAVARTLEQLPEQTRTVFNLTRGQHLSYNETARQLGVSVKTVEKHMSRALAALRRTLREWL